MNVAITGSPASGKSTLAAAIEASGYRVVSAGSIMRARAEELGISIGEMQRRAADEDIDSIIDRTIAQVPSSSASRWLIDARMGWAFAPMCLSVLVRCDDELAAARILGSARKAEAYADARDAAKALAARRDSEVARYQQLYGLSYAEDVFDIVIDTSSVTPDEAARTIVRAADALEEESIHGTIRSFRGSHFFLSNMYETEMTYGGLRFRSSESAYQAQKTLDPVVREEISKLDGKGAKRYASQIAIRDDWARMRRRVMESVVLAKFRQNKALRERLLQDTDGYWLEEGNTWGDCLWGTVQSDLTGRPFGANLLGRTLMKVRRELAGREPLDPTRP